MEQLQPPTAAEDQGTPPLASCLRPGQGVGREGGAGGGAAPRLPCSCPVDWGGAMPPVPPNSAHGLSASALWGVLGLGALEFSQLFLALAPWGVLRIGASTPQLLASAPWEVLGLGLWVLAAGPHSPPVENCCSRSIPCVLLEATRIKPQLQQVFRARPCIRKRSLNESSPGILMSCGRGFQELISQPPCLGAQRDGTACPNDHFWLVLDPQFPSCWGRSNKGLLTLLCESRAAELYSNSSLNVVVTFLKHATLSKMMLSESNFPKRVNVNGGWGDGVRLQGHFFRLVGVVEGGGGLLPRCLAAK
nr:uncharacterized protein LOC125628663 [Caretta caretta]XP_048689872.1 uncharacterized protein LOC125628663 [Caretta caretta]